MENLLKDKMLTYNDDTLNAVRKEFNLNKAGAMEDAVNILEEWVKQQNHFTKKNFDRRYLENTIILNKGSIERTKRRLDRACTLKSLMPHFFEIYDLKQLFKDDLKGIIQASMPKMTKNNERVYILKIDAQLFKNNIGRSFMCAIIPLGEYIRRNDYQLNSYVVADFTNANLTDLASKLTVNDIQEIVTLGLDYWGFRVRAIYIISESKLIDVMVAIYKKVLSEKIGYRIYVLKDKKELLNLFDADILPKDYGGNEKPLDVLHEEWLEVLTSEDFVEYLRHVYSMRTDETLRQKDVFNNEYIGIPGTFRTLTVD